MFWVLFFGALFTTFTITMKIPGLKDFIDDLFRFINLGKLGKRIKVNLNTGVTFNDVAGADEAKEELAEIVDFLK